VQWRANLVREPLGYFRAPLRGASRWLHAVRGVRIRGAEPGFTATILPADLVKHRVPILVVVRMRRASAARRYTSAGQAVSTSSSASLRVASNSAVGPARSFATKRHRLLE